MPSTTNDLPGVAPMILARSIRKRFGVVEVLKGVSLEIVRGDVVAVIGPSGSGKSTFLRCLNHLETIDSGTVAIEGETLVSTDTAGVCPYAPATELRRICRELGMVFHQLIELFQVLAGPGQEIVEQQRSDHRDDGCSE